MKSPLYLPALAAAIPLALAMPLTVHAQSMDGYLNDDTVLRAGPAPEYPEIDGLPYGTYVSVQGCTEGWEWCDVVSEQGDWGWVPGDYIDYVYEGEPVVVTEYGPRIGIPVVTFSITNYWDEHYRDRPFYRERSTWYHRDIPHRAAPPPHHVANRRPPPPPPPGGWHHGGEPSHHGSAPAQPHHVSGAPPHSSNGEPQHHGYAAAPPHHENPPNPPRVPVNEPQHPGGDHHANIPTPPMGAPPHEIPHAANMPRPQQGQPPRGGHVPPPPHPASSTDHGKHPPPPHKKDDHDNGDDNGH
jgi:uncharacterized protein YraI